MMTKTQESTWVDMDRRKVDVGQVDIFNKVYTCSKHYISIQAAYLECAADAVAAV